MAVYEVVYNRHDKLSSDAHVGSHPTPTSTVVAPLAQSSVATIEAGSIEDSVNAARVAYGDPVSDFFVRELTSDEAAGVVVAVHQERPEDSPAPDATSPGPAAEPTLLEVAAGQPTQERPTGEPVTLPEGHTQEAPSTTEAPSAADEGQGTAAIEEPSNETPAGTPVQEPVPASVPDNTAHQAAEGTTEASDPARGDGETTSVNPPGVSKEDAEQAAEAEAERTADQTGTPADVAPAEATEDGSPAEAQDAGVLVAKPVATDSAAVPDEPTDKLSEDEAKLAGDLKTVEDDVAAVEADKDASA